MANAARSALQMALVYGYTIFVMLGMGASIDVDFVAEVKKAPKAVLCGVASQFGFMPFIAWALCEARAAAGRADDHHWHAIGLILSTLLPAARAEARSTGHAQPPGGDEQRAAPT